jgi:Glycerophosphoryl diester phosphodiesterase family
MKTSLMAMLAGALWVQAGNAGPTAAAGETVKKSPVPLLRAHAHNDYEHPHPLGDALDQGFCSVEADIYLVDGKLLVAHDADKVSPERTLEGLYLKPLEDRVRTHRGHVYPDGPAFTLLIDIKSEAEPTYAVLRGLLRRYRAMLTEFSANQTKTNAVTVILSGNRPAKTVASERRRWAGIDGRLDDLAANPSRHLVPLISDNWQTHFEWRGEGPLSPRDDTKLAETVARAHGQGRWIRFWAVPDRPEAWRILRDAGVDLINTDRLRDLREFLTDRSR